LGTGFVIVFEVKQHWGMAREEKIMQRRKVVVKHRVQCG
jgi:hypothetical protein